MRIRPGWPLAHWPVRETKLTPPPPGEGGSSRGRKKTYRTETMVVLNPPKARTEAECSIECFPGPMREALWQYSGPRDASTPPQGARGLMRRAKALGPTSDVPTYTRSPDATPRNNDWD
jgi:hypothetical protein